MTKKKNWRRLDQILVEEGAVTEDQIFNALSRQRQQGGRIGMHLLLLGYIDEATLVKTLAKQSNCNGVVLTGLEIPPAVLKFIPARVAVSRKVIPFDYNPEDNVLKVACETPQDNDLIQELLFVARGKRIKLHVSAELPLINAIAHYYMGMEISPERPFIELPPLDFETKITTDKTDRDESEPELPKRFNALILSDDSNLVESFKSLVENDNYFFTHVTTVDEAEECVKKQDFEAVFIKQSSHQNHQRLISRLRRVSPHTRVKLFDSSSDLLLSDSTSTVGNELTLRNLELFTSLLDSRESQAMSDNTSIGLFVKQLCDFLCMQPDEKILITSAGYLCGLARHYYGDTHTPGDRKPAIAMTSRLLRALSYPISVTDILDSTYLSLTEQYTSHLPLHILGGNIITIVDYFHTTCPETGKLTLNRIEQARQEFHALEGNLFLPEIVKAFFDMLTENAMQHSSKRRISQVLLYAEDPTSLVDIEKRLQDDGYRTISECDGDGLAELYIRSLPDMIVLLCHGDEKKTLAFISDLRRRGIDLPAISTFVLTSCDFVSQPEPLIRLGVNEILPLDDCINLLGIRLNNMRKTIDREYVQEESHPSSDEVEDHSTSEIAS